MLNLPTDHLQTLSNTSHGNSLEAPVSGIQHFHWIAWVQSLKTGLRSCKPHMQSSKQKQKVSTCQCLRDYCLNKTSVTAGMCSERPQGWCHRGMGTQKLKC